MEQEVLRYDRMDPAIDARVDDLLGRMTLVEKVGQLVQVTPFLMPDPEDLMEHMKRAEEAGPPAEFTLQLRPNLEDQIRAGSIGSIFGSPDVRLVNRCQRLAVEESRLGIPLLVGNDVIHGFRTIFPIPLAEACTWDPVLLERAARAAAEEASASGTDWIFAPMVDVARDPRWGRIAEGAGEDPFLGMAMARARVRGFQASDLTSGRRIAACPKHYVAYGAAEAGRDYNTVDISERTLREVYLPPFKAAFDAGAGSVMSSFNEIGGVPSTCNAFTLRTVLRDEWGWPGVVLSDYEAVRELVPHGVAADLKDAARLSILAGLDMDMMGNAYAQHLAALVDEGAVPEKVVDEAVRRVLRLKLQLGLFAQPYVDETLAEQILLRDDFRALALQVAQESMVLLKNDGGLLPLSTGARRIAVVGPLADARRDLLGTWAVHGRPEDAETVLEGMSAYLNGPDALTHVPGCPISGDGAPDLSAAMAAAQGADVDVVVLVLGESADMSGEAHSRSHLGLPGRQQELLDAVSRTGKPIVGVLMSGRPLVIPRMAEQVGALLVAWHGGIRAGRAVADLLFGAVSPSGKLTASWPRTEGQIPIYYAHKNTGRPVGGAGTTQFDEAFKSTYLDEPNAPLFPFGFGLSYTTFAYRDLAVEKRAVGIDDTLVVTAVIKNTGERAGAEVVQLYVRDLVGSVTRPVKELKGFQRITLQPGEEQTVRFEVPVRDLGFMGLDMRYTVEPGAFKIWVGPNSTEGLEGEFEVRD
jgi:beta-glucosidase